MGTPASSAAMMLATFMCYECQGFYPTEVALAKHLMDHNRLKALGAASTAATTCEPVVPAQQTQSFAIQMPYQVPPPPPMCNPKIISTGTQQHTGLAHGNVVHYNDDNGFGFIKRTVPGAPSSQVYFHISTCNIQTPRPRCGESVYFTEKQGPKGPRATSLVRSAATTPAATNVSSSASVVVQPPLPPGNRSDRKTTKPILTMLAESPSFFLGRSFPRFVYVDLDNVWVSFVNANHLVGRFPSATSTRDLFFNLDGFTRRLATGEEGSSVSRLVAFYFNTPKAIANRLRKITHGGVTWDVRKQEATTDTTMQLELLNAKRSCEAHPKTLVLVTGDGNIAPNGMCFREILDLYLRDGWFVEVHAWLSSLARSYIEFQRQYPSTVVIRPFDDEDVQEIVNSRMQINSESSSTHENKGSAPPAMQREHGIVVSYEVVGGFGTIAKVGAAAGSYVHFQSSVCNIKRPPPTVGEKVMLVESMGSKGPTASVVYRKVSNKSSARAKMPQTAAFQGKNNAAAKGRRSHTQDDLAAAQTRAMRAMSALNSPKASSNTNTSQKPAHPAEERVKPTNQRQLRAEHYEYIIDQLNHSEFGLYLPSALAILRRTHEQEASNIEQTGPATQRELLLVSLQDELEHARLSEIAAEWTDDEKRNVSAQPPSPSPEPEPPRTAHCEICMDEEPLEDMFFVRDCNHAYCRDSMRSYILGRMEREDITPTCPSDDCVIVISDVDVSMVLTLEEQGSFYKMSMKLAVESIPSVFECLSESCRGVVDLAADDSHFVCPLCHSERCVTCNTRTWHDGLTCEQYRQREHGSQLHPEQLRGMFGTAEAFQCGGCGFGPILRSGCDNLQTHHGQAVGNARVDNTCPSCGWFAADIAAWPRWNGEMRG